jgi:RHH-type proline utilization regulon transcriptional repressor/proline dehydrogenase/delta 1-pyrroline-5-carboxylate dehydrogenase
MNDTINFRNEPFTDYTIESNRILQEKAISEVVSEINRIGFRANPIVNGETFGIGLDTLSPTNPSQKEQILGTVYLANNSITQKALEVSNQSIKDWSNFSYKERSKIIKKAAEIMRARRFELNARIILEAGKTWKEADADVAEAIDFCDYYAQASEQLFTPFKTQETPGENNYYSYKARGVAVVISPWNFPLAIACGMSVAALVTGNPTILKPAEQSSFIAQTLVEILYEAGIPKHVLHFLPGIGEDIGAQLVSSPLTSMICFTGSRQVGLAILEASSKVPEDQHFIKKIILELGGKNAIIVDEDADLDEAIKGILYSSFGFAGQKCSACSRLIVVGTAYETLLNRLSNAVRDLIIGEASDSSSYLGPVIDEDSYNRINSTIELGKNTLKLLTQGNISNHLNGYYVAPTIFYDVNYDSPLWIEEIFGPVVCATKVESFDDAIKLANNSKYALTGGVFSRNPENIEKAKNNFEVGNLYINRGCTGAMVQRQPFGGFKMSGIGSKAGGKDYLLQFVEPRTISENVMRRGFSE